MVEIRTHEEAKMCMDAGLHVQAKTVVLISDQ